MFYISICLYKYEGIIINIHRQYHFSYHSWYLNIIEETEIPLKSADQNRLQVFRNDLIYKWTINL